MADVTKLEGYAVLGISDSSATLTKISAYAITSTADSFASLSKLVGYAVVVDPTTTTHPQVFVCT